MDDKPYKLAVLNNKAIAAAANRALMAAESHYFSWPTEQQDRFRVTMQDEALKRVQRVLLDNLLGIQCSLKTVDKAWADVNPRHTNLLNWASLLTRGLGDDMIYLNEWMADGESLLDFPTLYDFDHAQYLFQEKARHQDSSNYAGMNYYAWAFPSWVRLLINNQFYYATFLSLATHVCDELESVGDDLIDKLIPHHYVDGEEDGKQVRGGIIWDRKLDAAGQEGQLDELRAKWYSYQRQRWIDLSDTFSHRPPAVYSQNSDFDDDPHRLFIFNNAETLKNIRWRHFFIDSQPFMTAYSTLDTLLSEEIERATAWLTKTHEDIMTNFDPTVVRFKKKRNIVMSHGALDDLAKIDREDDPLD